jgi:hypothetical protein
LQNKIKEKRKQISTFGRASYCRPSPANDMHDNERAPLLSVAEQHAVDTRYSFPQKVHINLSADFLRCNSLFHPIYVVVANPCATQFLALQNPQIYTVLLLAIYLLGTT